jgi:hypothetical protein
MRSFDKDGERINQFDGRSGLVVTDKNRATKNRFISIPKSSKEEMFALTKKEFIRENGVSNGDTTKRSEVYRHMYPQIKKDNRLAAGFTLRQYERQYREAFEAAVKQENPNWTLGMREYRMEY